MREYTKGSVQRIKICISILNICHVINYLTTLMKLVNHSRICHERHMDNTDLQNTEHDKSLREAGWRRPLRPRHPASRKHCHTWRNPRDP